MSTYLVTGGAGFIGSHLADALLAAGHAVRILDDFSTGKLANVDQRVEITRGDVAEPRLVRDVLAGADGCFHLAAIASVARANEDWLGTHRVNLGGTIAVLDAARSCGGVPVVYASSAAVYGRADGTADERSKPAPLTAYGADKYGSELHAVAGREVHGLRTLGLRFFNVYGPRQDPASPYSGVISIFCRAIAAGQPITVHGDGSQTRDFIYVGDVLRFLLAAMAGLAEGKPGVSGAAVNACTGRETAVIEMAHLIAETLGETLRLRHGPPRPGDIQRSRGSPDLARALLGVEARVSLAEGLRATLQSLVQLDRAEASPL